MVKARAPRLRVEFLEWWTSAYSLEVLGASAASESVVQLPVQKIINSSAACLGTLASQVHDCHAHLLVRSSPGFMCACKIPGNVKDPQWKGHFFWGGEVTAHCGFFSTSILFCSRSMETRCYASEHVQRIYHSASRAETVGGAAYVQARTITRGTVSPFS